MFAEGSIKPLVKPDRSELLTTIGNSAIQLVGAERVSVLLLSSAQDEWETLATQSLKDVSDFQDYAEPDRTAVEKVLAENAGFIVNCLGERHNEGGGVSSANPRQASTMYAPLRSGEYVVGVIVAQSHSGNFDSDSLNWLQSLADLAATAIENQILSEDAKTAKQARSEFVSLVTHQLRVPLTSIKGYTDLLLTKKIGPLSEQQHNFLSTIRRNAERMNVLIRDLAAINRIDDGRMQFDPGKFNIRDALDGALALTRDSVEERGQRFRFELTPDLPVVYADCNWVSQILAILIDNASQYSPKGGDIAVTVGKIDDLAEVQIADKGIGISEADQACLFSQFFRSEDSAVRQVTGWGLGLALAKGLAEAMGGQVRCQSMLGEGSTFTLTMPLSDTVAGAIGTDGNNIGISRERK